MELSICNIQGEDTGRRIALESSVSSIKPNDHAIYLTIRQYRANRRQGTHKTKERSEMGDSTRKLFRQKGTGGARRDDINSNILRDGTRVFGPRPHGYSFKLSKKLRQPARHGALAYKAQDNQIIVLDQLSFKAPKTKSLVNMAKALDVGGQKILYVASQIGDTVVFGARNISDINIICVQDLNTYCMLSCRRIAFTEGALAQVNEMF